jgi:hypothetical protein
VGLVSVSQLLSNLDRGRATLQFHDGVRCPQNLPQLVRPHAEHALEVPLH